MTAFANQVASHRPMLMRTARQRLRNDAWAEDAVSETLMAALERPDAFAGRAVLRTWLVGILKHKLVDQVRRHRRETQINCVGDDGSFDELSDATEGAFEAPAAWGDPQEELSRRQLNEHLDRCLKKLPPQQARAVVLRDWMEEETGHICDELGVTSNNLAVMLHRARRQLRASLQASGLLVHMSASPQAGASRVRS